VLFLLWRRARRPWRATRGSAGINRSRPFRAGGEHSSHIRRSLLYCRSHSNAPPYASLALALADSVTTSSSTGPLRARSPSPHYPDAADVWSFRRRWSAEKRRLQADLRAGHVRLGLLTRITKADGTVLDVWSARDAMPGHRCEWPGCCGAGAEEYERRVADDRGFLAIGNLALIDTEKAFGDFNANVGSPRWESVRRAHAWSMGG